MPRRTSRRNRRAHMDRVMMSYRQQFMLHQQNQLAELMEELIQQRGRRLLIEILRQREERAIDIFNILEAHRDRTRTDTLREWHAMHGLPADLHHGSPAQQRGDELLQPLSIEEVPRHGASVKHEPAAGGEVPRQGAREPPVPTAGNRPRRGSFERVRPNPFDL